MRRSCLEELEVHVGARFYGRGERTVVVVRMNEHPKQQPHFRVAASFQTTTPPTTLSSSVNSPPISRPPLLSCHSSSCAEARHFIKNWPADGLAGLSATTSSFAPSLTSCPITIISTPTSFHPVDSFLHQLSTTLIRHINSPKMLPARDSVTQAGDRR